MRKMVVHTDGGCRDNPGPGAWAFVLDYDGKKTEAGGYLGYCTNNQAEYRALEAACVSILRLPERPESVDIYSDSQLIVEQINLRYKVNDVIKPFFASAFDAYCRLRDACQVSLTHVKREFNKEADAICNQVMDKHGVVCSRRGKTRKSPVF